MKNPIEKLTLTAILVEDPKSKGYTAFFAQFPYIIAEGTTDNNAVKNLWELVQDAFKHQNKDQIKAASEKTIYFPVI